MRWTALFECRKHSNKLAIQHKRLHTEQRLCSAVIVCKLCEGNDRRQVLLTVCFVCIQSAGIFSLLVYKSKLNDHQGHVSSKIGGGQDPKGWGGSNTSPLKTTAWEAIRQGPHSNSPSFLPALPSPTKEHLRYGYGYD